MRYPHCEYNLKASMETIHIVSKFNEPKRR